jgi:hypothetical protein
MHAMLKGRSRRFGDKDSAASLMLFFLTENPWHGVRDAVEPETDGRPSY